MFKNSWFVARHFKGASLCIIYGYIRHGQFSTQGLNGTFIEQTSFTDITTGF